MKNYISGTAPFDFRNLRRVVVRKIVFRKINIQALFNIAEIFFCKRIAVIFGVTCREEIAALHIGYQMHTRFLGIREYLKILYQRDVAAPDFRMP